MTQIFSYFHNCQFHHRRLVSLAHFIVCAFPLYNSGIPSTTVSSLDLKHVILFLHGLLFKYVHYHYFSSTLCMYVYVFNVCDVLF